MDARPDGRLSVPFPFQLSRGFGSPLPLPSTRLCCWCCCGPVQHRTSLPVRVHTRSIAVIATNARTQPAPYVGTRSIRPGRLPINADVSFHTPRQTLAALEIDTI